MYRGKIGVGIITCNRLQTTTDLIHKVADAGYVDSCIVVKNRNFEYGRFADSLPSNFSFQNIVDDVGVGFCKNRAFEYLLDSGCEHIFMIEDDVIIKSTDVFKHYIDTALFFNLGHLVFGYGSSGQENQIFDERKALPFHRISYEGHLLDFYENLQGGFCYYSKKALRMVGLMDAVHYVNALEHVEHTFRLSMHRFYTPFWAFADVHDSRNYLDWQHNVGQLTDSSTTIEHNPVKEQRTRNAFSWFRQLYNIQVYQIPRPSREYVNTFIKERAGHEGS